MARDPLVEWWERPFKWAQVVLLWILIGACVRVGWDMAGWLGA